MDETLSMKRLLIPILLCGSAFGQILTQVMQKAPAAAGASFALVQSSRRGNTAAGTVTNAGIFHLFLNQGTLSGNAIVCAVTGASAPTWTVTTDQSQTLTALTASAAEDSRNIQLFYQLNATTNTREIKASPNATKANVGMWCGEFSGIPTASAIDGTAVATNLANGTTSVAAGSITPTQTGDFFIQCSQRTQTPVATSFTKGSQANITWTLLTADRQQGLVCQYGTLSTSSALNPTMSWSASGGVTAAAAFKTTTQGTAPSGMYAIHHDAVEVVAANVTTPMTFNFPTSGTVQLMTFVCGGNTSVVDLADTSSNPWYRAAGFTGEPGGGQAQGFYTANATATTDNTVTATIASPVTNGDCTFEQYDYVGLDTTEPIDTYSTALATDAGTGNLTTASITPSNSNGTVFSWYGQSTETATGCTGTGFLFDASYYTGQSTNGPSTPNENNGWCHIVNSGATAQTFIYTKVTAGASGGWAADAVAMRASGAAFTGNWVSPRVFSGNATGATSATSTKVNVHSGDLMIVACYDGTPSGTPITDSLSSTWNTISNLNPYNDTTDTVKITVKYALAASSSTSWTATCNGTGSQSITLNGLVITDRVGTPTLHTASGTNTGRNAGTTHTAASQAVTAGDLVFAGIGVADPDYEIINSGSTTFFNGDQRPDGGSTQASGSEWAIAPSTTTLSNSFTTPSSVGAGQVIAAWTP